MGTVHGFRDAGNCAGADTVSDHATVFCRRSRERQRQRITTSVDRTVLGARDSNEAEFAYLKCQIEAHGAKTPVLDAEILNGQIFL